MTLIDTLILGLVVIIAVVGLVVLLLITRLIELRNPSNNKILYSALVISLFFLVLALFAKVLLSNKLGTASNDECEKEDPPFWCHLETDE